MNSTHPPFRLVLWIFTSLTLASLLVSCTQLQQDPNPPNSNSINIKLTAPWSTTDIQAAFLAAFPNLQADSVKVRSCPCDPNLINIKLPQNWIIEGHSGNMTVKSDTDGATGGEDIPLPDGAITGINYPISTFDDSQNGTDTQKTEPKLYPTISLEDKDPGKKIKVAVFDSGLNDQHIVPDLYTTTYLCKEGGKYDPGLSSQKGWNFVGSETNTDTREVSRVDHGSRVAYLLAKQFNGSPALPLIVPMRVLDSENKGDLFGLMCAMETARLNGIKVFNVSLGYYGTQDPLLKSYVDKAVAENIWIITAAGNRPPRQPNAPDTVNRNMATMSPQFYPAYFASELPNVLAATTVLSTTEVKASARQNYGEEFVLGVLADRVTNEEGRFLFAPSTQTSDQRDLFIFGTSYAAPVLAGRVARLLAENPAAQSQDFLQQMEQGNTGSQVRENRFWRFTPRATP